MRKVPWRVLEVLHLIKSFVCPTLAQLFSTNGTILKDEETGGSVIQVRPVAAVAAFAYFSIFIDFALISSALRLLSLVRSCKEIAELMQWSFCSSTRCARRAKSRCTASKTPCSSACLLA